MLRATAKGRNLQVNKEIIIMFIKYPDDDDTNELKQEVYR